MLWRARAGGRRRDRSGFDLDVVSTQLYDFVAAGALDFLSVFDIGHVVTCTTFTLISAEHVSFPRRRIRDRGWLSKRLGSEVKVKKSEEIVGDQKEEDAYNS